MRRLRWGILGTGGIARKFAGQLPQTAEGELVAVGSRSLSSAKSFCAEFGGTPYGTYNDLLNAGDVDAVYISLPNTLHATWSITALRRGKHVLCEKPLAAHADEAAAMFAVADETGRNLMEAFMYRQQEPVQKVLDLVHGGAIGQTKLIRSHFTYCRPADPSDIRYQPELAGGSIMDVGCYCVNFARAIVQAEPTGCHAIAHMFETGVDDYAAGTLNFDDRVLCVFTCGMSVFADRTTFISGTEGFVAIEFPWMSRGSIRLVKGHDQEQLLSVPCSKGPYALEADAFARVVLDGADPPITAADTLGNMSVLDQLRRSAGLSY